MPTSAFPVCLVLVEPASARVGVTHYGLTGARLYVGPTDVIPVELGPLLLVQLAEEFMEVIHEVLIFLQITFILDVPVYASHGRWSHHCMRALNEAGDPPKYDLNM